MIYTTLTCFLFCQFNNIKVITEYKKIANLERYFLLGWIVWQILDGFLIYFGAYKDGNGYELKGW